MAHIVDVAAPTSTGDPCTRAVTRADTRFGAEDFTGWATLPLVFVKGVLVGGAEDLERLIASGELKRMLG